MVCGIIRPDKTGNKVKKSCTWNEWDTGYLGQTIRRCGILRPPPPPPSPSLN